MLCDGIGVDIGVAFHGVVLVDGNVGSFRATVPGLYLNGLFSPPFGRCLNDLSAACFFCVLLTTSCSGLQFCRCAWQLVLLD